MDDYVSRQMLGTNLAEVGTDCISRQTANAAICNACGKIDCDKMDKCENLQLPPANISETPNSSDKISRQAALDIFDDYNVAVENGEIEAYSRDRKRLCDLPPAQPEQRKEILYRHYKGGTYELVCNNVTHTETGESLVVYRDCRGQLWARPE